MAFIVDAYGCTGDFIVANPLHPYALADRNASFAVGLEEGLLTVRLATDQVEPVVEPIAQVIEHRLDADDRRIVRTNKLSKRDCVLDRPSGITRGSDGDSKQVHPYPGCCASDSAVHRYSFDQYPGQLA